MDAQLESNNNTRVSESDPREHAVDDSMQQEMNDTFRIGHGELARRSMVSSQGGVRARSNEPEDTALELQHAGCASISPPDIEAASSEVSGV